ncbi:MAG: DUF429 domain-containing protein [Chloroflexi bacterium]|nr:DUF429 domain-containing protein [Chloroflexota bacterium]
MQERQVDTSTLVAGADGCKGGWIVAAADSEDLGHPRLATVSAFRDIWTVFGAEPDVLAVDMPVGLVNNGSRQVDGIARKLLGKKSSSVFTPPERMLLEYAALNNHLSDAREGSYMDSYEAVNEWAQKFLDHGVPPYAFGIFPKIAEVDRYMTEKRDPRVHEAHPELAFRLMNGHVVVEDSKRTEEGATARAKLLQQYVGVIAEDIEVQKAPGADAAIDDLHDALALLWTAARINSGDAERIPEVVDFDPVGLDMAMWF